MNKKGTWREDKKELLNNTKTSSALNLHVYLYACRHTHTFLITQLLLIPNILTRLTK